MENENLKKLYENVRKANPQFNVPYDRFAQDMQVEENRRKFHANLPEFSKDFNVPYEKFVEDMGFTTASEHQDTIKGFVPGVKQGTKTLVEGSKIAAGNIANLATGSSRDAQKALDILDKHGNEDYNPRKAYWKDIDDSYKSELGEYKKQMDEWHQKHPSLFSKIKGMLPFVGDKPEEPKNPHLIAPVIGDVSIDDKVDMRPYKLVAKALEQGDIESAKAYLRQKAEEKTWGDEVEAEAIKEMATLKPTEGVGAWVGNLIPQMLPNALAIAASLHPTTRPLARPLGAAGMGVLSASSGGAAIAEARQYAEETGKDIPESDIINAGLISTAIEVVTEYIPYSRYMSRVGSMVKKRVGSKVAQDIINNPTTRKEVNNLFKKAAKTIPGRFTKEGTKAFLGDLTAEALSEFTAESLDAIVPMIYANKEDYPTLYEVLENGIEGAKAGLFMGAFLGGGSIAANNYAQNQRRKQQGSITIADTDNGIVELLGEKDNQYTVLNDKGEIVDINKSEVKEARTVGWDEFKEFSKEVRKENISNNAYANLEASEKRIIKENLEEASNKFDESFQDTPFALVKDDIANSSKEQQEEFIIDVATSEELSEQQKKDAVEFIIRSNAYNSYNQSKEEIVNDAVQDVADLVQENLNPRMNAVVTATLAGSDNPVQIIDGNIVQREDGSIDRDKSDKQIFYIDENGNKQVASIDFIENIEEIIFAEEATTQMADMASQDIISQQENEEVREYQEGEEVSVLVGNLFIPGIISGINPETGNYLFTNSQTGQQTEIEPRQIVNEDNLIGIEQGDEILYRDAEGSVKKGELNDLYNYRMEGNVVVNGEFIPVSSIIGPVRTETEQSSTNASSDPNTLIAEKWERQNFTQEEIDKRREYGLYPIDEYETTYRGVSKEEWEAIKKGDSFSSEGLSKNTTYTTPSRELASESGKGVKADLVIEFKPESKSKMAVGDKKLGSIEYYAHDLTLDDVYRVYASDGNILYDSTSSEKKQTSPLDKIPKDEKDNLLFEQVPVSDTLDALSEVYEFDEINDVIDATITTIQKQIEKTKVPKPTGNITKDIANKQAANQQLEDLNGKLSYWEEIRAQLKKSKPIETEIPEKANTKDILSMGEPLNGEELAATMLASGRLPILYESYKKETGGGNEEARGMFGLFVSKEKGGMSIGKAGEQLMLADYEEGTNFFDQNDPNAGRNAIIEVLSQARTRGDLINYIKRNREAMAKRELQAEYEAYVDWFEDNLHMTPEEYKAYEEVIYNEIVRNALTEEDFNEIISIFINEQTSVENERQRAIHRESETSNSILQREESVSTERSRKTVKRSKQTDSSIDSTDGVVSESPSGGIHQRFSQRTDGKRNTVDSRVEEPTSYNRRRETSTNDARQVVEGKKNKREQLVSTKDEIAQAESETNTNPTQAQKEAGNYKKGKVTIQGFDISIEQPKGSTRSGTDENGNAWSVTMNNTYGYIRKTEGKDGDHIDVFLGDNPESTQVFVVDQVKPGDKVKEVEKRRKKELDENSYRITKEVRTYEGTDLNGIPTKVQVREMEDGSIQTRVYGEDGKIIPTVVSTNKKGINDKTAIDGIIDTELAFSLVETKTAEEANLAGLKTKINKKYDAEIEGITDNEFDEHKVMLGFNSMDEAKAAYLSNYEEGWQGLGNITEVDIETFRKWVESDTRRIKPFAEYKEIQKTKSNTQTSDDVSEPLSTLISSNPVQMQINWDAPTDYISQLESKEGDPNQKVFIERQLNEQKNLTFMGNTLTGAAKIETTADVAWLFKNLESAALENAFLVMIRPDGTYGVYYMSTGATDQTSVDFKLLASAVKDFGASKICFVHNHPSGRLIASNQDVSVHDKMQKMFSTLDVEVMSSVIINLDSGKYLKYGDLYSEGEIENVPKQKPTEVIEPKVYQFDRQKLYKLDEKETVITNPDDVALFLSKQKRGTVPKIQVVIMDTGRKVTKYLLIDPNLSVKELSSTLIYEVGKHGNSIIIASNGLFHKNDLYDIQKNLNAAGIELSDVLHIKQDKSILDSYMSYMEEGILEPKASYDSSVNEPTSVSDIADANNSTLTEDARIELDMKLKSKIFKIREAWEDRYLAVKEFQDVLRSKGTRIEEYNDFYLRSTHLSGMNDSQLEVYNKTLQRPLNKAIRNLEKKGLTYRNIENYAILKHGLERNQWMRQNSIDQFIESKNGEVTKEQLARFEKQLPDDYAGVTAVEEEVGMKAEEFISQFEKEAGNKLIENFWKKVNAATRFSLRKNFEGGFLEKKTYDELIARYKHYIPLRGHDEVVAEDKWDYSPIMGTYFVNPIIKANGRRSRSEKPFAFIAQQAQSSITASNKNTLTQAILRLANKDKTGLMSVSKAWYELKGEQDGQPIYEQVQPEYSEDAKTYQKNIEKFEKRMRELEEHGLAFQSGKKLNIGGLFIKPKQAEQHQIPVHQNGVEYVVYINGNPAVARAINGSNIKDTSDTMKMVAKMSRFMAANFTTRNPLFVATNFSRDYIFASSILPVKENVRYALQFQKNIPVAAGALQRYIRGKADLTKAADRYLVEYIMNGAKTGYSHIVEINKVQKEIEKDIKKGDRRNIMEKTLQVFGAANEFAENLSRLSVYITSRNSGRSVVRSVSDAKEVTVNFNRSGAGSTVANFVRPAYLFVNAGIQSLSNITRTAVKNPKKTAALFTLYTLSGSVLAPMLAYLLGGDDGLEDYLKLGEWERQNNLCLYTGEGFIKIPFPHELRVFHRVGDHILNYLTGNKDLTETMIDIPLSFSDLIPIDPMGAVDASWAEYTPDFMRPFTQLAANRNFMGSLIYNEWISPNAPGYTKARTNKKGRPMTPDLLVSATKALDNLTGGDGVESGLISINPDIIEHFAKGYFGGLYTISMQSIDMISKVAGFNRSGDAIITVRDTPLKTFFTSKEDLRINSGSMNKRFFNIKDDVAETRRKIKGYQKQASKGEITFEEYASRIDGLSNDIEKMQHIYPYIKLIEKYEKILRDLDGEQQQEVEQTIFEWKKEAIEINSIKNSHGKKNSKSKVSN